MSDDGLLLNFAPSPVAGSSKPSQQRGQQRRHLTASARKHANGHAAFSSNAGGPSQRIQEAAQVDTSARTETNQDAPVQESTGQWQRQSKPSIRATSTSNGPAKQSRPGSGKPQRGNAVISSLFAGPDALQEERTESSSSLRQTYDPTNAPSKVTDFASVHLDPLLVSHLASDKMNNIKRPTGIQRTALPFLLSSTSLQRDALLHAQTGSGKTLCYLLPIMQSLLPYCQASWIDRSCLGTLAIILAPTRELARQIYDVAEAICSLHLGSSGKANGEGEDESVRRTRWIVPGLLSGGATKNHEKSRLRKGIPLIVATPGRLLDHLRNTASLDVGRLQWLVLDEADRLLQLGFEETLNDILKAIEGRRRAASELQRQRMRDEMGNQYSGEPINDADVVDTFGEHWWKYGRRTVLCSATLDEGVQVLAGKSLREPKVIRVDTTREADVQAAVDGKELPSSVSHVAAPAQLLQNFVVTPTKQRLVLLVALIRQAIAQSSEVDLAGQQVKIMVFLSCTDSVDFHLAALCGVNMARDATFDEKEEEKSEKKLEHASQLLPATSLFKLHGSMTAQTRQASLKAFAQCKQSCVLFCTSVASRGLDLRVSHVIQVDPPTEKGADEYIHRIGRTARAGQRGESWLMLLPSEKGCVAHYESAMRDQKEQSQTHASLLRECEAVRVLRDGFGGVDLTQTQTRATDAQMALERWTAAIEGHAMLARRAYLSHLRAYATHPPSERSMFAVASLQLGHLAKAFALREAPAAIRAKVQQYRASKTLAEHRATTDASAEQGRKRKRGEDVVSTTAKEELFDDNGNALPTAATTDEVNSDDEEDVERPRLTGKLQFQRNEDTEARMYAKVRELGKLHKRQGVMGNYGAADEFQIA